MKDIYILSLGAAIGIILGYIVIGMFKILEYLGVIKDGTSQTSRD